MARSDIVKSCISLQSKLDGQAAEILASKESLVKSRKHNQVAASLVRRTNELVGKRGYNKHAVLSLGAMGMDALMGSGVFPDDFYLDKLRLKLGKERDRGLDGQEHSAIGAVLMAYEMPSPFTGGPQYYSRLETVSEFTAHLHVYDGGKSTGLYEGDFELGLRSKKYAELAAICNAFLMKDAVVVSQEFIRPARPVRPV